MSNKKEVAVGVNNIHKDFILPQNKNSTFKQTVVNIVKKNDKVTQRVLDGISFEVYKGDFFGIVGRNGSGKSTLLKLIAGVYTPTSGDININGGLTPFIELGVGFNPELSGRDNVYLNGALLGFNRKQMNGMYEDIVAFAELGPFMDQKLKNYSSGMQVRLAFSIAVKAKNEILIFDEVLAVGDEAFQRKCLDVFEKYKAEGQTVILVTHDMNTVRRYCNRALLLNDGKVVEIGFPQRVADSYSLLNQESISKTMDNNGDKKSLLKMQCTDINNNIKNIFNIYEDIRLNIKFCDTDELLALVINIYKQSGEHITGFRATLDKIVGSRKNGVVIADIPAKLTLGKYYFLIQRIDINGKALGNIISGPEFLIVPGKNLEMPRWSGLIEIEYELSTKK